MRTLIAIPCMDMVHTEFMRSCIGMGLSGEVQYTFSQASLIYDARNKLAGVAIRDNFDRVLWLDSDMSFDRTLFQRLSEHLDQGKEMVCGLYTSRRLPIHPVIYSGVYLKKGENGAGDAPVADTMMDFPRDRCFEVSACGFGAVMMTTDLLQRVQRRFGLPFSPILGFGEDLSFCMRVHEIGAQIWCDPGVRLGHVGQYIFTADDMAAAEKGGTV